LKSIDQSRWKWKNHWCQIQNIRLRFSYRLVFISNWMDQR